MKKKRNGGNACPHCNAPKRCHPITAVMVKEQNFPRVCMLEFKTAEATPLPFDLRSLTDDDKIEIQDYLLRTPSSIK